MCLLDGWGLKHEMQFHAMQCNGMEWNGMEWNSNIFLILSSHLLYHVSRRMMLITKLS